MPIICTKLIFKTLLKKISTFLNLRIKKWMRMKEATLFQKIKVIHLKVQANIRIKWSFQGPSKANNKTAILISLHNLIWFLWIIQSFTRWISLKHQSHWNFFHSKNINKGKVMARVTLLLRYSQILLLYPQIIIKELAITLCKFPWLLNKP